MKCDGMGVFLFNVCCEVVLIYYVPCICTESPGCSFNAVLDKLGCLSERRFRSCIWTSAFSKIRNHYFFYLS